jgi:predicted deacylase
MNNKKLKICDVIIHPGEEASLSLPLPEYYSCAPLYMPIRIIHGKKKGPCLLVFSTLNGNELNGIEIVNRIMEGAKASQISGTIIAIPVLNVYGLTNFPKVLPSGGTLDGCFPGSKSGTYGERFAHIFTQEILKKADYCIELQTGKLNHNILPQVYCDLDNLATRKLAKAFNAPVIMNISLQDSSLRRAAESLHIPLLAYQAGEAMRFDQNAIEVGFNGVKNIMRYIDLIPKAPIEEVRSICSQDEEWVVAHKGGILHTDSSLGQVIKKGQVIGTISDPFGAGESEKLKAPKNGIIVGINTTPLIHEGLSVFKVASFIDYDLAETTIEEWDKKQEDSFLS